MAIKTKNNLSIRKITDKVNKNLKSQTKEPSLHLSKTKRRELWHDEGYNR